MPPEAADYWLEMDPPGNFLASKSTGQGATDPVANLIPRAL